MEKDRGVIVRKVDDLGRIVIPKEIRKILNIPDGQEMEVIVDGRNGEIVLRKYRERTAENEVFLNDAEHSAYMEDFSEAVTGTIGKIVSLADKHNVDRDNAMRHFSAIFSTMVQISTFEHFGESGAK